jgi:hypothetical protein
LVFGRTKAAMNRRTPKEVALLLSAAVGVHPRV